MVDAIPRTTVAFGDAEDRTAIGDSHSGDPYWQS